MPDQKVIAHTHAKLGVPTPSPSSDRWLGHAARLNWAWAVIAISCFVCIVLQSEVYLNHDVAWFLYSSGQMLEGQVLYRDILAANPPLIWYLNLPPAWLAKVTGIPGATIFRIYVVALACFSLVLSWRVLQSTSCGRDSVLSKAIIALAAIYWLVLPGREFGQREHLMLMLAMPYVVLAAAALSNDRLSFGVQLAGGIMAGIGFSLKPYFLVVPILLEIHQLLARRPIRWKPRPDFMAMAAISGLYLLSIPMFAPDYFSRAVPLFRLAYWGFESSPEAILATIAPELVLLPLLLALSLYNRGRPRDIQGVLATTAVGLFAAYAVQGMGFAYHAFPFQGIMLLWILVNAGELVRSLTITRRKASSWVSASLAIVALFFLLTIDGARVLNWYRDANMNSGAFGQQTTELIDLVNRYAGNEYFTAFSTHPYPGFPIANYSRSKWGARTVSQFMIPAIAQVREKAVKYDFRSQEEIEGMAHQLMFDDLVRFEPALILIDARPKRYALKNSDFDILGFYLEDPRFRELWAHYTEISPIYGYRIFLKRSGVSLGARYSDLRRRH